MNDLSKIIIPDCVINKGYYKECLFIPLRPDRGYYLTNEDGKEIFQNEDILSFNKEYSEQRLAMDKRNEERYGNEK